MSLLPQKIPHFKKNLEKKNYLKIAVPVCRKAVTFISTKSSLLTMFCGFIDGPNERRDSKCYSDKLCVATNDALDMCFAIFGTRWTRNALPKIRYQLRTSNFRSTEWERERELGEMLASKFAWSDKNSQHPVVKMSLAKRSDASTHRKRKEKLSLVCGHRPRQNKFRWHITKEKKSVKTTSTSSRPIGWPTLSIGLSVALCASATLQSDHCATFRSPERRDKIKFHCHVLSSSPYGIESELIQKYFLSVWRRMAKVRASRSAGGVERQNIRPWLGLIPFKGHTIRERVRGLKILVPECEMTSFEIHIKVWRVMRRRINRHLHKTSFAGQMRRIKGEINGTTKTSRFVKNERRRFPKWTSHDQQDKPPMSVTFSWIRESLLEDEISTNRHNLQTSSGPTVEREKHDSYINQPATVDSKSSAKFLYKNLCGCRHVDLFSLSVCLFWGRFLGVGFLLALANCSFRTRPRRFVWRNRYALGRRRYFRWKCHGTR